MDVSAVCADAWDRLDPAKRDGGHSEQFGGFRRVDDAVAVLLRDGVSLAFGKGIAGDLPKDR